MTNNKSVNSFNHAVASTQRRASVPVHPVQQRERREPIACLLPPLHSLHDEPRVSQPIEKHTLRTPVASSRVRQQRHRAGAGEPRQRSN